MSRGVKRERSQARDTSDDEDAEDKQPRALRSLGNGRAQHSTKRVRSTVSHGTVNHSSHDVFEEAAEALTDDDDHRRGRANEDEQAGAPNLTPPERESSHEEDAEPVNNGASYENDELDDDYSSISSLEDQETAVERMKNQDGHTARHGVVDRIELINFMCHKKLVIELGPRLNFVIGHNGSGKSAILTGITLGLGAKASVTSRGNSVKSFIKEGEDTALIEVTLLNRGHDAYKREIFGKKIIIERIIRKKGSDSWKIKTEKGRTVATHRKELDAITDHFNIQVDNPMNVLTQDQARSFLTGSDPSDMYEFFLRGTQLQQLHQDYLFTDSERQRTVEILARKREGLQDIEIKAREAKERVSIIKAAHSERLRLDDVKNEAAWSFVQERERELEDAMTKIERLKIRRENLEKEVTEKQRIMTESEDGISQLEARARDAQEREEPLRAEQATLRATLKDRQARMRELQNEEITLNHSYRAVKAQIKELDERVEESLNIARGDNSERARLLAQRKQAEVECKKLERQHVEARDRLEIIDGELESITRDREDIEHRIDAQRDRIASVDTLIRRLRAAKANHLTAFGPNMPALVQKVEQLRKARAWRGPVVGPIGSVLKVKEPKWVPVLESVIGNTLSAFCVTNHADRMLLQRLKRECRCDEVSILTGSDEQFDYSAGEPDGDLLTILRVLDIPDGFVRRQLINALHIERSVLVERRSDGDDIFQSRRRNVKVCFSGDLFRVSGGEGGNSTQTLQRYGGAPRLPADVEASMAQAQQALPDEEEKLRQVMRDHKDLLRTNEELSDERRELRQRISSLQKEARAKYGDINRMDDELAEKQPDSIAALTASKKELQGELQILDEKFRTLSEKIESEEGRIKPLVDRKDAIQSLLRTMVEESSTIVSRIKAHVDTRLQAVQDMRKFQSGLENLQRKIDDAEPRVNVIVSRLKDDEKRAAEFGERVEATKSSEEYKREIAAMETQIRMAHESEGMDLATLTREMQQRLSAFNKAREDIDGLELVDRELRSQLATRMSKWSHFRRHISMQARSSFTYFMQTRGYEGTLSFNHDKQKLFLGIKTEMGPNISRRKDTRSLSGGEKSFSTICLLLALWEAIGCPIRALDEFDVFMDAVNRRMSMRLIADAARLANNTQFILITPQNMANVPLGDDVRVLRLQDPERGP